MLGQLLQGSDIHFHSRRLAFMREFGLTPEQAAKERPGFDQSAGSVTGIMALEGSEKQPQVPPIIVVNDYLTSCLAQVGVVAALKRRAEESGSYHVHVSLTRVALWLISLGIFDKEWAHATGESSEQHRCLDPETFTALTTLGDYQGVTEKVTMSLTPGAYDPVLVPRGSSRLEWR